MYNNKQLWNNALAQIELNVSRANFTTWFKNTQIVKEDRGIVYIGVPNGFVKEWLFNKYHKFILKSLRDLSENIRGIEYIVTPRDENKNVDPSDKQKIISGNELPLKDLYIDKGDNLNPRYVFESFVVGPFNELSFAAAQAVIKNPGLAYNPLFIYGNTGLGKTHLIQAIGNKVKEIGGKKIYYITSEKFFLDYINSVQSNKISIFKERYRKYDFFIMDDIQFFSGKQGTQEELFHLFNVLTDNNKQIIFSSDKHYNYIPNIEDRLKSRFGAGMIVNISEPNFEERVAILRSKLNTMNFSPSDNIIEHIASTIKSSIREMEGILNTIICQSQLKNRDLTINEVSLIVKNNEKPKKMVSAEDVIEIVSDFYSIEKSSIYQKTRRKEIVKPRQIIMYILREDFNISYPAIGQKLGGRDHTTVIHSCEKVRNNLKNDMSFTQEIDQIRSML